MNLGVRMSDDRIVVCEEGPLDLLTVFWPYCYCYLFLLVVVFNKNFSYKKISEDTKLE